MRLRISGEIYRGPMYKQGVPTHMLQAMLLNRLGEEELKRAHSKVKQHCLFTYSSINIDFKNNLFFFYFSSTEDKVQMIEESFMNNNVIRLGNYHMRVSELREMQELEEKERYLFKGKVLASTKDRKKLSDTKEIEEAIYYSAISKLALLGMEDVNLSFQLFKNEPTKTFYKKTVKDKLGNLVSRGANIPGHYIVLGVEGDTEAIKTLHAIGFGQNTGTGNGLLWEVDV